MDIIYFSKSKITRLFNLTFINTFLIVINDLFALKFNKQSSGFGITSSFHSILKYCGICHFFLVLRCSETPNALFSIVVPSLLRNELRSCLEFYFLFLLF